MIEVPQDAAWRAAQRMLERYARDKYSPEERATDHAFSYDSEDQGRKFWLAVLQAMQRIRNGESYVNED